MSEDEEKVEDPRPLTQRVVEEGMVLARTGKLSKEDFAKFLLVLASSDFFIVESEVDDKKAVFLLPDDDGKNTVMPMFSSLDRAESMATQMPDGMSAKRVPMATILFQMSDGASIALNPADDEIHLYLPDRYLKMVKELHTKNFPFVVGGLYLVKSGDAMVLGKILALDDNGVHLRVYENEYPCEMMELPTIEPDENLKTGIEHAPYSFQTFLATAPVFLSERVVKEEEMSGYKLWQENNGGYF